MGNVDAYDWFKFQSFSLAAIEEENIRLRVKAALGGAIKRGETIDQFYANLKRTFQDYKKVELKALALTYDTQMSLAFGASQQAKMIELQDDFPYWRYSAVLDSHTRPEHAALHGKIFAATDHRYFPPIGFRCRCTAIPMTARQAGKASPDDFIQPTENKTVGGAEFIGNKQKQFAKWLEKRYEKAEPYARNLIIKAKDSFLPIIVKDNRVPSNLIEWENHFGVQINKDVFQFLRKDVPLEIAKTGTSNFDGKRVLLTHRSDRSKHNAESLVYHEYGHAIDSSRQLRQRTDLQNVMTKHHQIFSAKKNEGYKKMEASIIAVNERIRAIVSKRGHSEFTKTVQSQLLELSDTIASLSKGKYGYGHSLAYWKPKGRQEAEFIAHAFEAKYIDNPVFRRLAPDLRSDMTQWLDAALLNPK